MMMKNAMRRRAALSGIIRTSRASAAHHQRSFSAPAISLSVLKDLRTLSGAPMMECKKALESSNGEIREAMDWLRKHGAAKASSKLAGRDATEGLVGVKVNAEGTKASIVKVASETDFAGRSSAFVTLVTLVAEATLESTSHGLLDDAQILEASFDKKTVKDAMDEAIVAIRENLRVSHAQSLTATEGILIGYVHGRVDSSDVAGTAAAVVHVAPKEGTSVSIQLLADAGKKLAMHIVAAKPIYLSPADVPQEEIEREKEILRTQMANTNKPPEMLEKIVIGKMRKFYEVVCLTEQAHMVIEGNPTVSKAFDEMGIVIKQFEAQSI